MTTERWTPCARPSCGHTSATHGFSGICMAQGCGCVNFVSSEVAIEENNFLIERGILPAGAEPDFDPDLQGDE